MSLSAILQVFDASPMHWTPATRLVALVIADHTSPEGVCWPSVARIARRSGLSPRTVQTHLSLLVAEGVLIVEPRYIDARQTTNFYRWTMCGQRVDKVVDKYG